VSNLSTKVTYYGFFITNILFPLYPFLDLSVGHLLYLNILLSFSVLPKIWIDFLSGNQHLDEV